MAVSAGTIIGVEALAGPAESDGPRGPAIGTVAARAPSVTVADVSARGTTTSGRTTVRTTVRVENRSATREPASVAWLSLQTGTTKYALGHVSVPSLAPGASTTVRATHPAPRRAPAAEYSVLACSGAYSATACRTSTATVATGSTSPERPSTGVMLDVARAYYPVPLIERYVDLLAEHGGTFLHLHLTDDQNVGIESDVLGQTLADADLRDGVWTSRVTHRPFLSAAQAREIADHAAERGVAVVPEVDTPGHMAAAFALLEARHGEEYVDRIRSGTNELDVSAPASAALAARVVAEVERTFPGSRTVHIGGDEWGDDVSADDRVAWLDAMAAAAGDREVWAWNDGIDRAAIGRLDPRIRVTYWSFDGDTEDPAERRERRQHRAGADDLSAAGTDLLSYDSYHLYEVPTDLDPADSAYAATDLRAHWSLRTWDGDTGARLGTPMSGAAVAIWGEDLEQPPSDALLEWSRPHVVAMIETARS
ncbi:family 20 glycosylhydrolase [Curtobacterium sp. MCSS17_007]|uniref:family 20 glycosylhydrolase n=1 Tax=Curtobacterium sp. MCSS17_007 TaxID=2175646 RepID=UPI0015E88065|nr:family 20 glycosylhydrolase [Curtobacterium sp. MCSS17_007]WIE76931.1 family 20 glycosylhydrolase [Curtobacterium sp. MCSS17_007]